MTAGPGRTRHRRERALPAPVRAALQPVSRGASGLVSTAAKTYSGWVPFLCVLAAIALLATSAITWVTAPNWGLHNVIAAPRDVGKVAGHRITQADQSAPIVEVSPFSLDIPAIKAEAPIVEMGTSADRELDPPLPPTTVGWWKYGAKPGAATGTAIIAGHINYSGVAGALAEIGRLNPGDKVIVHGMRNGKKTELTFTITGVRTYSKKTLPWQQIFNQQVSGRLALVTCGGPFDASTGNYLDNIVAYAVLA